MSQRSAQIQVVWRTKRAGLGEIWLNSCHVYATRLVYDHLIGYLMGNLRPFAQFSTGYPKAKLWPYTQLFIGYLTALCPVSFIFNCAAAYDSVFHRLSLPYLSVLLSVWIAPRKVGKLAN